MLRFIVTTILVFCFTHIAIALSSSSPLSFLAIKVNVILRSTMGASMLKFALRSFLDTSVFVVPPTTDVPPLHSLFQLE